MNIDTDLMLTITAGVLLAILIKYVTRVGISYIFGGNTAAKYGQRNTEGSAQGGYLGS